MRGIGKEKSDKKKKKTKSAKRKNYDFSAVLKGRKLPLLILDEQWLELFSKFEMPQEVRQLQQQLSKLVAKQGKLTEELNGLKRYKSQLLQEIVENMGVDDTAVGQLKAKKMDKNQRLVNETREKIETLEEMISDLPREIQLINEELLIASSYVCYDQMKDNKEHLEELIQEIDELNDLLKMKLLEKYNEETNINLTYTYLHNMYGARIMELLDREDVKE